MQKEGKFKDNNAKTWDTYWTDYNLSAKFLGTMKLGRENNLVLALCRITGTKFSHLPKERRLWNAAVAVPFNPHTWRERDTIQQCWISLSMDSN